MGGRPPRLSLLARLCQPFPSALDQHIALPLGQISEDRHHEPARRVRRVEPRVMAFHDDSPSPELVHRVESVHTGASKAVEASHDETIPFPQEIECGIQAWPLRLRSRQ